MGIPRGFKEHCIHFEETTEFLDFTEPETLRSLGSNPAAAQGVKEHSSLP